MRTADDSNSFIEAANRLAQAAPGPTEAIPRLPTISEKSSSEVPGPASTKPPRSTQPVRRRTDLTWSPFRPNNWIRLDRVSPRRTSSALLRWTSRPLRAPPLSALSWTKSRPCHHRLTRRVA